MLNPEYQSMALTFTEGQNNKSDTEVAVYLIDDEAGDAFAVLRAFRAFAVAAGFTWVKNVAFEKEDGEVIFSDGDRV